MHQTTVPSRRARMRRALALLMALTLTLGLVPGLPGLEDGASAHWADPYLSQLAEWGFIRADQAGHPDRALTRADFMAITNRAYGYHELGETPFEDVAENDWFYDDVGIAYTAKYIKGTSPTTASPNSPLTRETAATILGRNMMLQESGGELLDFTDARQISNWARGTVKSSLEHYLVSGYSDGTFRPQRNVSWGEMAAMVTNLIGTPLQEPGDYSLGGTFGNVTITSPGVTLRDTVISGDLYISGGVGLGGVTLENVTVLGRIIASGTGSSEGGQDSILLRNVTADELLIDNLQGNAVSVRADGVTEIGRTTVRTSSYIEDNTPDGMGLKYISLEGESYPEGEEPDDWEPVELTLAGRIEEVVNKTPQSIVHAASGTVAKLTVDEAAEGSQVIIDRNTTVKELDLDTATTVTGEGDIGKLVVNAPGCVVEMLPDEIEIRPGITAEINGEEMDSVAAKESSEEPLILAGYPEARDIIPTGLDAVFMTNKAGTIYWAVSAVTDGSIGEEDLIKPPSYGNIAVANGSLRIAKGNEETTAKIGGLTPGGSYYLSAVLVDARDKRSTVKVISFTTPDNTTPAFCTGYPRMSKVSRTDSVVVVMPNKDCKLYYALLPEGAAAPTENELKTASVAGALGYGVRDVKKNVEDAFRVNDVILDETTTYVLYLWLVDADGVNKSAIFPLTFTTDDETPPEFIVDPTVNRVQATSVGLTFRLNENGTVYWVAVPAGTLYPKPEPGTDYETAPLNSDYAKLQVSSGMNVGSDGKSGRVVARENTDGTITVSGLKPETSYDLYYVAKDNAGPDRNYSVTVKKITINTLDTSGPKFSQYFTKYSGTDNTVDPMSNTDIYLDVTENVRYTGQNGGKGFLELYQDVRNSTGDAKARAIRLLAENLAGSIRIHKVNIQDNSEETVLYNTSTEPGAFTDAMTIDYTQATVTAQDNGGIRITFPASGLHLENGGEYYFTISEITDTSNNQNPIVPSTVDFKHNEPASRLGGHNVPPFVVEFAAVNLSSPGVGAGDGPLVRGADGKPLASADDPSGYEQARIDMSFRMTPTSTGTVSDTISYDILLWSDSIITYDLYYRVLDETGAPVHTAGTAAGTGSYDGQKIPDRTDPDAADKLVTDYLLPRNIRGHRGDETPDMNGWFYLGNSSDVNPNQGTWSGKSVNKWFNNCGSTTFPRLNTLSEDLRYEFVISLRSYKGNDNFSTWNGEVKLHVNVAAGQSNNLDNLAGQLTTDNWERFKTRGLNGGARSIGRWNNADSVLVDTQELSRFFTDSSLPQFYNSAPRFENITSTSVDMYLALNNPGTVYYVIGKASTGPGGTPEITTTRYVLDEDTPTTDIDYVGGTTDQMYVTLTGPHAPTDSGNVSQQPMPNWMKGTEDAPPQLSSTDQPGLSNKLITPTSLNIFSPGSWASGANAISGSVRSEAFRVEPETVENLEPNTDYFAYFVIKGEADDLSHVYVYHFKTNKSAKPKIGINPVSNGSVDMWTDIPATMAYILFSVNDAQDKQKLEILTQPFDDVVDKNGDYVDVGKRMPDCYKGKTVLDALCTTYSYTDISADDRIDKDVYIPKNADGDTAPFEGGYSVFDIYASANIRRDVDELIRNNLHNTGATRIDYGSNISSPGGGEQNGRFNQALKDVNEGNKYVILTVAQTPNRAADQANAADYELDSFKGYYNVEKSAGAAPNLMRATLAEAKLDPSPIPTDGLPTFTGTLTLTFDKDLWTHDDTDTNVILTKDNINRIQFTPHTIDFELSTTGAANAASDTITATFTKLGTGQTVTLPGRPKQFYNASDVGAEEQMEIKLVSEEREEGKYNRLYVWYEVTWGIEGQDPDYKPFKTNEIMVWQEKLPDPPTDPGNQGTGGGTSNISDNEVVKPTLTLSDTSVTLDMGGKKTATVTATATPGSARVTWTSANSKIAGVSNGTITAVSIGTTTVTATAILGDQTVSEVVTVKVTDSVTGLTLTSFNGGSKDAVWSEADKKLTLHRGSTTTGTTPPSATLTVKTNAPIPNTAQVYCAVTDANGKALKTGFITCERTGSGTIKVTVNGGVPEGTTLPVKVTLGLETKTGGGDLTAKDYTFTIEPTGSDSNIWG